MNTPIDLTHPIHESMPVYPGTRAPRLTLSNSINIDGYREHLCEFQTHTGTHVDAPSHIIENGATLSDLTADKFVGKAVVLAHTMHNPLSVDKISSQLNIDTIDFILIKTNWNRLWGQLAYFRNYPVPGTDVINYLLKFDIKGIGIDAISIDEMDSRNLPNHRLILSSNRIIIENLTNLELLGNNFFEFSCLPLNIKEGDGSPVRAVARIIEK